MRHCELCKKTSRMVGTRKLLRGHYNPTNWTRKYPNLQPTRIPEGGLASLPAGRQVLACTQCIKTFGKATRLEKRKAIKAEMNAKAVAAPKVEVKPKAEKKETNKTA